MSKRLPEGITLRHQRTCPNRDGGRCRCTPTYQAQAWSPRDRKRLTRTFPTLAAAKGWRHDAIAGLRSGKLVVGGQATLKQAAEEWLDAAKAGLIRNRSGDPYKPSALRGYEQALMSRVLPVLGDRRLADIRRSDIQRLINRLMTYGLSASTIRNAILPLRAIYRHALALDEVAVNPTRGLHLPASRGRRDRIAAPAEARKLLDALTYPERALWATALFAGLRRGELMALEWKDVDLERNVIRVERSWDVQEGPSDPKSAAGTRTVPIVAALRVELLKHRVRQGRRDGLVFGRTATRPFNPKTANNRAAKAWKAAELVPLGLHEARHTYASLMIAAGVNAKALSTFMGHASITITLDRYGHLFPGSEEEAAGLLDAYLSTTPLGVAT
ncbi:MAG: tyrosine-type recombinase/integrase [Gaiellales bacterium]